VTRPPVLFYCQHLLGLGHAKRAAVLAQALTKAGEQVLFVTGGLPVPGLDVGGAEIHALPPLTAADEAASRPVRPDGRPPDAAYLAARRDRLLEVLTTRDPGLVLLELFPFGRHALAGELGALLLRVEDDRAHRGLAAPRVAVSLRDIVVSKANQPWYELTVLAVVERWVDRVLVHGSPDLIPLERTFSLATRLSERLHYTGYVAAPAVDPGPAVAPRDEVLISGGGGRVAAPLFRAALDARALAPTASRRPWRLLTGPYLPAETRAELDARAAALGRVGDQPAVVVETFRDDFPALLRGAALSVSQAGYNTVLDVVGSGVPAVVVPYEGSGDEQPLRAGLLAERGVLLVVPAGALSPTRLAAAMEAALATPGFPAPARLELDGAGRSAAIAGTLIDEVAAARAAQAPWGGAAPLRSTAFGLWPHTPPPH
jgi:predicted glycosyltransferase